MGRFQLPQPRGQPGQRRQWQISTFNLFFPASAGGDLSDFRNAGKVPAEILSRMGCLTPATAVSVSSLANGACREHRRHDTDGMRFEIEVCAQVERTNLLARRTREAEPREASRNRRANGRGRTTARAPQPAGRSRWRRSSPPPSRSASMRSASAVARAAARSPPALGGSAHGGKSAA